MTASSRKPYLSALLVLALASQLGACSKKKEEVAVAPATAASATAAVADAAKPDEEGKEEGIDQKLSSYIDCYNRMDGSAHRSISRYASWVKDMKAGPSGKERVVYGLYEIDGETITSCKQGFAEAAKAKPALALDVVGAAYIGALDGLNKVVEEAYPYYDRENYKDDGFAKGKQLHVQLAAQITVFQAASNKFSDELEKENDKRLEAQMNKLEKEQGRKLPYLQMATMHQAKQLIRLIEAESFAADQAATRLAAFEKITDETMSFGKASKDAMPGSWHSFESAAEDFRKVAKERVRRVRDKVPYSEGEKMMLKPGSAWMVEGSQEKLIKAYNSLVEASNSLQ